MPPLPFTREFFVMEGHAASYLLHNEIETLKYRPVTKTSMLLPWNKHPDLPRRTVGAVVSATFNEDEAVYHTYGDTSGLIFPLQKRFAHTEYARRAIHGHDVPLEALCNEIGVGLPLALKKNAVQFVTSTYHNPSGQLVTEGKTTLDITDIIDRVAFLRYLQSANNTETQEEILEQAANTLHSTDTDRTFLTTVPRDMQGVTAYAEEIASNVRAVVLNAYLSCARIGHRFIAESYRTLEPTISIDLLLYPEGRRSLSVSEIRNAVKDPYVHSTDLEYFLREDTVSAILNPDVSLK